MLKNNIPHDWEGLLENGNIKQCDVAKYADTSTQYIWRIINRKHIISRMFLQVVEACGYDVTIVYTVRKQI